MHVYVHNAQRIDAYNERCDVRGKIPLELKLQSPRIRHGVAKSKRQPRIKTRVVRREQRGEEDEEIRRIGMR